MPVLSFLVVSCVVTDDPVATGVATADTAPPGPEVVTFAIELSFVTPELPGQTSAPLPAGLCAYLSLPNADEFDTGTLDANGRVTFRGLTIKPSAYGASVDDCDGSEIDLVHTTISLVDEATYADARDGETVSAIAYGMAPATFTELAQAARSLQPLVDGERQGFVLGYARTATRAPTGNVRVDGPPGPAPVLYFDDDATDGGPFESSEGPNQATHPDLGAFLVADAPFGDWSATDESGALLFDDVYFGAFERWAAVVDFVGTPAP